MAEKHCPSPVLPRWTGYKASASMRQHREKQTDTQRKQCYKTQNMDMAFSMLPFVAVAVLPPLFPTFCRRRTWIRPSLCCHLSPSPSCSRSSPHSAVAFVVSLGLLFFVLCLTCFACFWCVPGWLPTVDYQPSWEDGHEQRQANKHRKHRNIFTHGTNGNK